MDSRAADLIKQGDALFASRSGLMAYWQVIAENFYPRRADFIAQPTDVSASENLFSSYPSLARRELGNLLAAMLRPRNARWFSLHVDDKALDEDEKARAYLEYMGEVQWRAMYDPAAKFVRATKEADHDYVTFGNAVIQPELDYINAHLLFRCHHVRDTVWSENANGTIDRIDRKWNPTARQLQQLFPDKISDAVKRAVTIDPETKFHCRHIVVPERTYKIDGQRKRFPFTSLYVEVESQTVVEEKPSRRLGYIIPRWGTVSNSQYGYSHATDIALPDARTMQAVVRTLREAAEKHVDPPMVAKAEVMRSDIFLQAGGMTIIDAEYDEALGDALRPIDSNPGAMPIGLEMAQALREDIRNAWYLDKINLPQADLSKMTAFAVRRLLEEQVRAQAPLFEPIEPEYSAPICNETFDMLREAGTFGPIENMPESLRGSEVNFTFQSPLRDIADATKSQQFQEGLQLVAAAAQFDPASTASIKTTKALKDSLRGIGFPQEWLDDDAKVEAFRQKLAKQAEMKAGADAMATGAGIAAQAGKAAQNFTQAGM